MSFIDIEANNLGIHKESISYQYLIRKTKASDRGSKARRSLGNLYALYVLCDDYLNNVDGSTFTNLMSRMKALPFGSKLQNHPLDNRLNDEVKRTFSITDDNFLPVQNLLINNQKSRKISHFFLADQNSSPRNVAQFIVNSISKYIQIISDNQMYFLDSIEKTENQSDFINLIYQVFQPTSDARLFEIVSFAILHIYFKQKYITLSFNGQLTNQNLILYRTGRTNANDGGIDFVLKPLGKFYQVTEVLDFKKYFLDFEKVNRFPISFVIKTDLSNQMVREYILSKAKSEYPLELLDIYMSLFDDIYTNLDLINILHDISLYENQLIELKEIISTQFRLEYGLLD